MKSFIRQLKINPLKKSKNVFLHGLKFHVMKASNRYYVARSINSKLFIHSQSCFLLHTLPGQLLFSHSIFEKDHRDSHQ